MFVLAHLSDPHLAGWSVDEIGSLLNKRLTGWLSWRVNRRRIHLTRVLDLLVDDLASRGADHVTVTGDLVNISLQQEFARAGQWLRRLGTGEHVTVIPGNHDAYVDFPWDEGAGRWAEASRTSSSAASECAQSARSWFDDRPPMRLSTTTLNFMTRTFGADDRAWRRRH